MQTFAINSVEGDVVTARDDLRDGVLQRNMSILLELPHERFESYRYDKSTLEDEFKLNNIHTNFDQWDEVKDFLIKMNAEAIDLNWLSGWMICNILASVEESVPISLYCVYNSVGLGQILSGFNHYIQSTSKDIEWNWICIEDKNISDLYKLRQIHSKKFICDDYDYLATRVKKTTRYNNVYISTDIISDPFKVIITGLNILNTDGIGFIRLPSLCCRVLNAILYVSSVSCCELIYTPWNHIYLKFTKFNDCLHETFYKYISSYLQPEFQSKLLHLYPKSAVDRLVKDIKIESSTTYHDWFDNLKKNIHILDNADSIYYCEF